jgi:DNA mismatch repair protein MutS2
MEARRRVEAAISTVQSAADEATSREARRLVEAGIQAEAEALEQVEQSERAGRKPQSVAVGGRVRIGSGSVGEVKKVRADGKLEVMVGVVRMVVDPAAVIPLGPETKKPAPTAPAASTARESPSEVDLRGMTGDEAEAAAMQAVDAAFLAERPFLRIIHGMGTGVVRERVRRVVAGDRRVSKFGFAPANQGGTGVTIVEFAE